MSGGHWAYQQSALRAFGRTLTEDEHPEVAATGELLIKIADELDAIDRIYSFDAPEADLPAHLEGLRNLLRR